MRENKKKVFIIAGETSGDILGAKLVNAVNKQIKNHKVNNKINKKEKNEIEFFGICGKNMLNAGVKELFNIKEIALMGFVEIVPSLLRIIKLINLTVKTILDYQPDLIVTIDAPGFNFRVVKKLRKLMHAGMLKKTKIIHYVAPTVWAYNPKRARTVKELYDHIMLLFPFEKKYFRNMRHTVIGHPAVEICKNKNRKKENNNKKERIITIMPGSREGEIKRHISVLEEAMLLIAKNNSQNRGQKIKFFIPTIKHVEDYLNNLIMLKNLNQKLSSYNAKIIVSSDDKIKDMYINSSDIGIIKSGTSTLEMALLNIPMICFYKVSPLTAFILKHKLSINKFALPNIILNENVIPELIQNNFTSNNVYSYAKDLLEESDARQLQLEKFKKLLNMIGEHDKNTPSAKAASVVLRSLKL